MFLPDHAIPSSS